MVYIQVLGTCTGDSDPSILLFFDEARYLFNIGEGTQRFCLEHKVSLKKVKTIFIDELSSDAVGGIPGALLTLADMSATKLNICGPQYTTEYLYAIRSFARRSKMELIVEEYENNNEGSTNDLPCYKDEFVKVTPIVLHVQESFVSNSNSSKASSLSSSSSTMDTNAMILSQNKKEQITPLSQPPLKKQKLSSCSSGENCGSDKYKNKLCAFGYKLIRPSPHCFQITRAQSSFREKFCIKYRNGTCNNNNKITIYPLYSMDSDEVNFKTSTVDYYCNVGDGYHVDCTAGRLCTVPGCPLGHPKGWNVDGHFSSTDQSQIRWRIPHLQGIKTDHFNSNNNNIHNNTTTTNNNNNRNVHLIQEDATLIKKIICYVIQTPDIKGKFYPAKAKALGLKPGPLYGKLRKGLSVVNPEGVIVTPEEVLGPNTPGPLIIMLKLPCMSALKVAISNPNFSPYFYKPPSCGSNSASTTTINLKLMIITAPSEIVDSAEFQCWIKLFGPKVEFIILNKDYVSQEHIYLKALNHQMKLSTIHSGVFPLPLKRQQRNANFINNNKTAVSADSFKRRLHFGENLLKFILQPIRKQGICREGVIGPIDGVITPLSPLSHGATDTSSHFNSTLDCDDEVVKPSHHVVDYMNEMQKFKNNNNNNNNKIENGSKDSPQRIIMNGCVEKGRENLMNASNVELVFLGTGSSIPSSYRNVSSIYLNIAATASTNTSSSTSATASTNTSSSTSGGILLDAGEGTYGQMFRRFGELEIQSRVDGLKLVWISHMHADHHLGLIHILSKRSSNAPALLVVGPSALAVWLKEYSFVSNERNRLLDRIYFKSNVSFTNPMNALDIVKELGVTLQTVKVIHCHDAYGVVLRQKIHNNNNNNITGSPWSLVYSGDTVPCRDLINAGKDCTILIHEATLGDGMEEDAKLKKHSTLSQALMVAREMNVYRCVLTHFSQRYPKTGNRIKSTSPIITTSDNKNNNNDINTTTTGDIEAIFSGGQNVSLSSSMPYYVLAYDFMSFQLSDLEWLPAMQPALNELLDSIVKGGDI